MPYLTYYKSLVIVMRFIAGKSVSFLLDVLDGSQNWFHVYPMVEWVVCILKLFFCSGSLDLYTYVLIESIIDEVYGLVIVFFSNVSCLFE